MAPCSTGRGSGTPPGSRQVLNAMGTQKRLLVVTDLDASLLDGDYSWKAATPALERLRALGIPLILNSSKTLSELIDLVDELGLQSPLIAENGGAIAAPADSGLLDSNRTPDRAGDYLLKVNGLSRDFILSVAHGLRERFGFRFSGFADWSDRQVADRTGLPLTKARLAKVRFATEPILWEDDEARLADFERALAKEGIRALKGGRFVHLMGTADKADGLKAVLKLYREAQPEAEWHTVALGDSANDLAMLEAADIAIVIPHADGPRIMPRKPTAIHAPAPATRGWNKAVLALLNQYG